MMLGSASMKQYTVKTLIYKQPLIRFIILTLLTLIISYFTMINIRFIMTLYHPIHLTSEQAGIDFLASDKLLVGDLEQLPIYYTEYDITLQASNALGTTAILEANKIYYSIIGNHLVLFQYKAPLDSYWPYLIGSSFKCYKVKAKDPELLNELKLQIASEPLPNTNAATTTYTHISDDLIGVFPAQQFLFKKLLITLLLGICTVIVLLWLYRLFRLCFISSYRGIRYTQDHYGPLKEVIEKVQKEEFIFSTKELILTENWLVNGKSKAIIKGNDIVWIYYKECHFPFFKHTSIYIHTNDHTKLRLTNTGTKGILYIYDALIEDRPKIIKGYSKIYADEWKQNPQRFINSHGLY